MHFICVAAKQGYEKFVRWNTKQTDEEKNSKDEENFECFKLLLSSKNIVIEKRVLSECIAMSKVKLLIILYKIMININ